MNESQRLKFIQASIRQALDVYAPDIEQIIETDNPDLSVVIAAIHHWLDMPTVENQQHLLEQLTLLKSSSILEYGLKYLIYLTDPENFREPARILDYLSRVVSENPTFVTYVQMAALQEVIWEWQIETSWAILQGRNVPPHPRADLAAIEAILPDTKRWYKKRKLRLLLYSLSDTQWQRFRRAVLEQALWFTDHHFPADHWLPDEIRWIRKAHDWFSHPNALTEEQHREYVLEIRQAKKTHQVRDAIYLLIDAFHPAIPQDAYHLDFIFWTVVIAGYADNATRGIKHDVILDSTRSARAKASDWQIEAAYAILTDQPIPPLGDPDAGR